MSKTTGELEGLKRIYKEKGRHKGRRLKLHISIEKDRKNGNG